MYTLFRTIHRYPLSALLGELRERWWADLASVKLGMLPLACPWLVWEISRVSAGQDGVTTKLKPNPSGVGGLASRERVVSGNIPRRSTHEKLQSFNFVLPLAREGTILLHSYTQAGRQAGMHKAMHKMKLRPKAMWQLHSCFNILSISELHPINGNIQQAATASTSLRCKAFIWKKTNITAQVKVKYKHSMRSVNEIAVKGETGW